jgi:uncharacterized protein YecE (DUF72 family)
MMSEQTIYIGTSGWQYDHWQEPFYPEDLPKSRFLEFYAEHFQTVEINNSFYQLPSAETLTHWREATPPEFRFSVKASRYITHMKKLKDPAEPVSNFLKRVELLADKLGPILFQLPPNWHFNRERLSSFLEVLPGDFKYTFELRDPSWLNPDAYELLATHNAAFCIYEFNGRLSPKEITADFIYIRLHGPDGPYQGRYDISVLAGWAGALSTWSSQGRQIYCYFDNDQAGYAVQNALQLQQMFNAKPNDNLEK